MPKAVKSKTRVTPKKVVAKKVTKPTVKARTRPATTKSNSSHTASSYRQQRHEFFVAHTHARMLLAAFIVAVSIYIGVILWGQMTLYSAEVAAPGSVQASF